MFPLSVRSFLKITLILIIFFSQCFFLFAHKVLADDLQASVVVNVSSVCGNNVKEGSEQCDGTDLDSQTCLTKGYSGGTLSCKLNCTFDTSNCLVGGGGGGGGGVIILPEPETKVIFIGFAYPNSKVFLLKDGQMATATVAGPDAQFNISLAGLSSGSYVFFLYGEDYEGRRSSPITLPITVTPGATTTASGIFIVPSIDLDKSMVKKGDNLTIYGQTINNADITISVNSENELFYKTVSDKNGFYSYNLDTSFLDFGRHEIKSKASNKNLISSFGKIVTFEVADHNILRARKECGVNGDISLDCRINLIDFSIMAYWYHKPNPPPDIDLNGDGNIDIFDFSILAYYWTG